MSRALKKAKLEVNRLRGAQPLGSDLRCQITNSTQSKSMRPCGRPATHEGRALSGGLSWLSCQSHVDRDEALGRQFSFKRLSSDPPTEPKKARKKKPKPHLFAGLRSNPKILALDLATRMGWACVGGRVVDDSSRVSGSVDLPLFESEQLDEKHAGIVFGRLRWWLDHECWSDKALSDQPDALVLEAPGGGINGRSLIHAAGLRGVALAWASEHAIPVASVAPNTLKLWASGSGRADKPAMIAAARRLYPAWRGEDDNEADALCLLAWGLEQAEAARSGGSQ